MLGRICNFKFQIQIMPKTDSKHFLEGPVLSSLIKLSLPIVLANMLQAGYQLVDAFWVGRLGGAAVAAVSISTPVIFLSLALGTGFALAGSILIAQYFGAGKMETVNHVAAQTLLLILIISILLGFVGYVVSPYFLKLLGVTPQVYDGALSFMRISFIGLVFNFTFFVFQSIMRGVGNVMLPVYIVAGTLLLNFALDPLFIFGYGIVPPMGVMGAALSTLITQMLAAGSGYYILFRGKQGVHIKWSDFRLDLTHMKRAFNIGFPASIEQSMRALGITMMTFLLAGFGTITLASYGAGSNIFQVVLIPALGLATGISTLAGQNIGAGNIERAASVAKLGSILGFSILSFISILVFFSAPYLIKFFVPNEPEVIANGSRFLKITCLAWGFMGLQLCMTGVLRASGNMITAMILTLISQWVLLFPLAYVLSQKTSLGVDGIWWAFPISHVVIALITMSVYAKGDWKKTRLIDEDDRLTTAVVREITAKEGVMK